MTGNEIINSVASELEEPDYNSVGVKVATSQEKLNDTLRDICNRHPFTWRVSSTPLSVPIGVDSPSLYDASDGVNINVQDFIAVVYDPQDAGAHTLTEISMQRYYAKWANVEYLGISDPVEYCKQGHLKFRVAPRPLGGLVGGIYRQFHLYYVPEFSDITVLTDQIAFPAKALEAIKLGLTARLYKHLREYDKATYNYTLYANQVESLVREDKDNPNLEFLFQGRTPGTYPGNYWANPFIRRVR